MVSVINFPIKLTILLTCRAGAGLPAQWAQSAVHSPAAYLVQRVPGGGGGGERRQSFVQLWGIEQGIRALPQ